MGRFLTTPDESGSYKMRKGRHAGRPLQDEEIAASRHLGVPPGALLAMTNFDYPASFFTSFATRSPKSLHWREARSSGAPMETGP